MHSWKVRAKNQSGIWGNYSAPWTFTIDTGRPAISALSLSAVSASSLTAKSSQNETNNPKPTIYGLATDNYYIGNVRVRFDYGSFFNATPTKGSWGASREAFSAINGQLAKGWHTVEAEAIDGIGNLSPVARFEFLVKSNPIQVKRADGGELSSGDMLDPNFNLTLNFSTFTVPINFKYTLSSTSQAAGTVSAMGTIDSLDETLTTTETTIKAAKTLGDGTYTINLQATDTNKESFTLNLTGLTVKSEAVITQLEAVVEQSTSTNAATLNLQFQSSTTGYADLIITTPSGVVVISRKIHIDSIGSFSIKEHLVNDKDTSQRLSRGPYLYYLKYGDKVFNGQMLVL